MRSNVKTIKLATRLSLILAVITYLISIKGVLGLDEIKWLPDTFLFAVFGGAFASMLVVMICEISKYYENRESTETFLYSHLYYLYGQLQVMLKNIDFLAKYNDTIQKDALKQLIHNSEAEMNTVFYIDYAPYKSNNVILAEKENYNKIVFPVVQSFFQDCRMFEVAVLTDDMVKIKGGIGDNTNLVLEKLSTQIQEPLSLLDALLIKIDQSCKGRYNWPQVRDSMVKGIPDTQIDMLEQFLGKK